MPTTRSFDGRERGAHAAERPQNRRATAAPAQRAGTRAPRRTATTPQGPPPETGRGARGRGGGPWGKGQSAAEGRSSSRQGGEREIV